MVNRLGGAECGRVGQEHEDRPVAVDEVPGTAGVARAQQPLGGVAIGLVQLQRRSAAQAGGLGGDSATGRQRYDHQGDRDHPRLGRDHGGDSVGDLRDDAPHDRAGASPAECPT